MAFCGPPFLGFSQVNPPGNFNPERASTRTVKTSARDVHPLVVHIVMLAGGIQCTSNLVSWDYYSRHMESHKIPWFQSPPTSIVVRVLEIS